MELDEVLGGYHAEDYSVRLVQAVTKVVPFAPDLPHAHSVAAVVQRLDPDARKQVAERAVVLARGERAQGVLWVAKALDTADSGITVYSGVRSAVKLYQSEQGERLAALETDPAQAADAVLKGLGIALMVHRMFEGGPLEKVEAFRKTDAGMAMLFYYAALDVGLPFTDNVVQGGGTLLAQLWERFGAQETEKLAAVAGAEEAQAAVGLLQKLQGPIVTMVDLASKHLAPIAEAAVAQLPKALDVADKVAGVAATGADALPVYRYLGARLAAEVVAKQALEEAAAATVSEAAARQEAGPGPGQVAFTKKKEVVDDNALEVAPQVAKPRKGLVGLLIGLLTAPFALLCGGC